MARKTKNKEASSITIMGKKMKKEKTVKAELWKISICGSTIDMVHGSYQRISELYIPSEGITCNLADEYLHCFETEKDRYGINKPQPKSELITKVDIPIEIVEDMKDYVNLRKKIETDIAPIFNGLE